MAKNKTLYVCSDCGYESAKWMGRCPSCGAWNKMEEQELAAAFGIRSIPTLLFIPMEGKPQMAQGALPKASLKEAIDKVMLGK